MYSELYGAQTHWGWHSRVHLWTTRMQCWCVRLFPKYIKKINITKLKITLIGRFGIFIGWCCSAGPQISPRLWNPNISCRFTRSRHWSLSWTKQFNTTLLNLIFYHHFKEGNDLSDKFSTAYWRFCRFLCTFHDIQPYITGTSGSVE